MPRIGYVYAHKHYVNHRFVSDEGNLGDGTQELCFTSNLLFLQSIGILRCKREHARKKLAVDP